MYTRRFESAQYTFCREFRGTYNERSTYIHAGRCERAVLFIYNMYILSYLRKTPFSAVYIAFGYNILCSVRQKQDIFCLFEEFFFSQWDWIIEGKWHFFYMVSIIRRICMFFSGGKLICD